MPTLHYGSDLQIRLDPSAANSVMEAVGAHATRGGWVTVTDIAGQQWSFLVSAGIPIWMDDEN